MTEPTAIINLTPFRWFAVVYLIIVFLLMPLFFIALSFSLALLYVVIAIILTVGLFITILNILQNRCPDKSVDYTLPCGIFSSHFIV